MTDQMEKALASFDGTHVEDLRRVVGAFEAPQAASLMQACEGSDARKSVAASWVVKALAETGQADTFDWPRLFRVLEQSPVWDCALHLLQSVQFAHVRPTQEQVRPWLDHNRTLVRVWALDAFVRLAITEDRLKPEARRFVTDALQHGPASLRARARALEKLLG